MAESISNETTNSKTDTTHAMTSSIEEDGTEVRETTTSIDFIQMLANSRSGSPIEDQIDNNSDVEYKLTENITEKIPSLLLDKFDFKIDGSDLVSNEPAKPNINDDDFIDEDLLTDLESTQVNKTNEKPLENNQQEQKTNEITQSILISNEADNYITIDTKTENIDKALTPNGASEPSPKLIKHELNENDKIQFKTNEMIDFIIKKNKQKCEKLKQDHKHSTLNSSEQHSRKKHHKNELAKTKSLMIKSTHALDACESAFIWTELEAFIKQHEQTGQSSCGASAIINVIKALNHNIDYDKVNNTVKINSRIPESMASSTTLAQYLFSRSIAGMNAAEMIENIQNVTSNQISGRFFSFNYSSLNVKLSKWLSYWIRKGAVPVALLNLQKTPIWSKIPDAWHHQMIYAISSDEIYLTNPLERKPIETMLRELNSESVLLIRTEDILKRFNANPTSLNEFLHMKDHTEDERKRWYDLNVLGQVISVLRSPTSLTHITIPASYIPGITLFSRTDSTLHEEILNWSDLSASNYL